MIEPLGYLASVGTSLLFSLSSIAFTSAGRKISSPVVNRVRLILALVFVMILHTVVYGQPIPLGAEPERVLLMGISGFIGFALGDAFLFQAYVMIGPRLSLLVMSLAPILTVLLAWIVLHERLTLVDTVGIVITLSGVLMVVSDRRSRNESSVAQPGTRAYVIGLLFALGGAAGQATGLIFSKVGLSGGFPAISGNVIRLSVAMIAIWTFTIVTGNAGNTLRRLKEHPSTVRWCLGHSWGRYWPCRCRFIPCRRYPLGLHPRCNR